MRLYEPMISHHEKRAEYWLSHGKPDYAEGSRKKAARWREKSRSADVSLYGHLPMDALHSLVYERIKKAEADLQKEFEDAIYG